MDTKVLLLKWENIIASSFQLNFICTLYQVEKDTWSNVYYFECIHLGLQLLGPVTSFEGPVTSAWWAKAGS